MLLSWPKKLKLTHLHSLGQQTKRTMALRSLFCSDFRIFATRRASTCFGLKRISKHLCDAQTTPYLRILTLLSQPGQTSRQSLLARTRQGRTFICKRRSRLLRQLHSHSLRGVAQDVLLRRNIVATLGPKNLITKRPKRLMAEAKTKEPCSN